MRIAVLGSSGSMGSFFVKYFAARGHDVAGSDISRGGEKHPGLAFSRSNRRAVSGADFVMIATPMESTVDIIDQVKDFMDEDATIVEICSVKSKIVPRIRMVLRGSGVGLLSIHPLFGPSYRSPKLRLCVIGGLRDLQRARSLFPSSFLVKMGLKQHDRLMASLLTLTHAVNLSYVSSASGGPGLEAFRFASTPIAKSQLKMASAVLSQDPSLSARIAVENPYSEEALTRAIQELIKIREIVKKRDYGEYEGVFRNLAGFFTRRELEQGLRAAYLMSSSS